MRILFVMPYPGYLRMYESTVRLLADRGHTVYLAYDNPDKRDDVAPVPTGASERITAVGAVPQLSGVWTPLVQRLRCTVDYLRYLDPYFADAPHLRKRMEKYLPADFHFLTRAKGLRSVTARSLLKTLLFLERAIPSDAGTKQFISSLQPDAVVVTPLVMRGDGGVRQTDTIKSARSLGIPVALAVGSWDHLTSKGLIRVQPDVVIVWNETQKWEATHLHWVPASKIVVTGAQLFDQWFVMQPQVARDDFHRKVGLAPNTPFLLYVGSSRGIADPDAELTFVRRWIGALRQSRSATLRELGVLVRPHPFNLDQWATADLSDLANVAVWPRTRPSFPMNEQDQADYFHSLYYSTAVVGINTSAMIEAAVIGRPVHTIRAEEFAHTQDGTLHFHYLLADTGGCVRSAANLDEHFDQILEVLRHPEATRAQISRFVQSFVRPHGLDLACTPLVAGAIEGLADVRTAPRRDVPLWLVPLRQALRVAAIRFARSDHEPKKSTKKKMKASKKNKAASKAV